MTKVSSISAAIVAAAMTAACGFEHSTNVIAPTAPTTNSSTAPSAPSMMGVWSSGNGAAPTSVPDPGTCTNFQFQITNQSATAIAGSFTATCGGGIALAASGTGSLNGNAVTINVSGDATGLANIPKCHFDLTANGNVEDNGYALPLSYSGTTCLGPVHGSETLRRPQPQAPPPPPPPAPEPEPTPPPPADPTFGCSTADKKKLVECIHEHVNPSRTVEGAFEVTKRVAWALRGEGAGLLIKNAGENIISWQGYSFSAGRICYPDGHIFKVLSDVPATNGPIWLDNDYVSPSLYVRAIDPNS